MGSEKRTCPKCFVSHDSNVLNCDCGYNFGVQVHEPNVVQNEKKPEPESEPVPEKTVTAIPFFRKSVLFVRAFAYLCVIIFLSALIPSFLVPSSPLSSSMKLVDELRSVIGKSPRLNEIKLEIDKILANPPSDPQARALAQFRLEDLRKEGKIIVQELDEVKKNHEERLTSELRDLRARENRREVLTVLFLLLFFGLLRWRGYRWTLGCIGPGFLALILTGMITPNPNTPGDNTILRNLLAVLLWMYIYSGLVEFERQEKEQGKKDEMGE